MHSSRFPNYAALPWPLSLSLWLFSLSDRSRQSLTLFLFLLLACLFPEAGYAKSLSTHVLLEDADKSGVAIGDTFYITEDALGEFSAQDIVLRHENNIRGIKNRNEFVFFPFKASPFWIIFEVRNNTDEEDWLLDFGNLSEGRSGIIAKLLVYEGRNRTVFFDGLRTNANNENEIHFDSAVPVTIPSNKNALFVLYVYPSDYRPLTIKPSLIATQEYLQSQSFIDDRMIETVFPVVCLVSAALLFCALLLNNAMGFIPLTAYYIGFFFWFTLFERPIFTEFPGADTFPTIIMIAKTLLILTAVFLTVPRREETSTFRVLMYFSFAMCLMTLCTVTIFIGHGTLIRPLSVYMASFLSLIIGICFLLTHITKFNRIVIICLTVWIALFLTGSLLTLLTSMQVLPHIPVLVHADLVIVLPQLAFILVGIIGAIKGSERYKIAQVIKKAQKAQALLKARQSKEASDQSRLLRVIEREREIMEELRGREAERTEEMRRAKNAADEANNSKSAFLAVVSHEIRTPMTGIMGMIRLLEETDLSPEQRDYAMTIKDSGDAMLALLNDILDFSKIAGGGLDLEIIEFDLGRVMNGVVMLMKGHADQKKINLYLDMDPGVPHILQGDPTRLRQIFLNLVGNALKFTSRGHVKIIVRCDPDSPAHNPDKRQYALYFAVEDTGIGISEDAQANLFTPFSQADSSISRKFGGTGLGLAICKRLVEAMGSQIQLFSREGRGTTFYFTIALTSPETVSETPDGDEASLPVIHAVSPIHVLIVDDNAINRKVIAGLIGRDGHSFDTVESGEAAIEILKQNATAYRAVFMDIELPGMNGVEATQIIRNELRLTDLPIVALTGNFSADDREHYREAGMAYHLAKPINPDHLRQVIRQIAGTPAEAPMQPPAENGDASFRIVDKPESVPPILSYDLKTGDTESAESTEPQGVTETVETAETTHAATETPQKAVPKAAKIIDEAMLKGLKDGLGAAQTRELLDGLFEKAQEIAPALQAAFADQDREKLRTRAHELKGMAGNFGLSGLSDKAAIIERTAREETADLASLEDVVIEIPTLIERSKLAIEKYLD